MRNMIKGFNLTSQKETLVLNKDSTILILEDYLDHGNHDGYPMDTRFYKNLNDSINGPIRGKNQKGVCPQRGKKWQQLQKMQ